MRYISLLSVLLLLLTNTAIAQSEPRVPSEKDMSAYLMVYFKDSTHSLHMALSTDGYRFTDVNNGNPVLAGDTLAEQKGIRDPYICRGPDGWFYMALTDLHIYAQRAGFRTTQWERDGSTYGWGNNRGFVMMKSRDLVNWSHTILRVDKSYPSLEDIGCAWAPELIYDEQAGKMMIYFSMRFRNEPAKLYWSYLNDHFDGLASEPRLLFEYPKDVGYIDGDITRVGNQYHLFYVPHDGIPGIKQAVSSSPTGGYVYDSTWYDPEPKSCEAPMVYKLIGQEKWILVYDVYGIQPHNFGFSETTDFRHFKHLGRFNEGVMQATNFRSPKHAAVMQITAEEAERVRSRWRRGSEGE